MRNNTIYLWNGWVHARETRRPLKMNTGWGKMKRLMEEAMAQHVEAIHYSASAGMRAKSEKSINSGGDAGFWLIVLEGFSWKRLKKNEVDRIERQVQRSLGWMIY